MAKAAAEGIKQNPTGHGVPGVAYRKSPTTCHGNWRGGQIVAITDIDVTIKFERFGTRVVGREFIPDAVDLNIIGAPVVVRFASPEVESAEIDEVRASTYAPGAASDLDGGVARGLFQPGIVPDDLRQ